jgi:hypothetical protein
MYNAIITFLHDATNKLNEEDKTIRKYVKTNTSFLHRAIADEADLLGGWTVWMGKLFPKFGRNVLSPSSGL